LNIVNERRRFFDFASVWEVIFPEDEEGTESKNGGNGENN